jgi:hypothetical protein
MAKVWVRVLGRVYYEENGEQKTAQAGDWVEIGKHQARQWLAQRVAEIPEPHRRASALDLQKCGVVVRGDKMPDKSSFGVLRHQAGGPDLPYEHTVIWNPSLAASVQGIEAGLVRLMGSELSLGGDSWEALATLVSLKTLAGDVGGAEERRKTEEAIGTLRVPVYETRLLWFRKTPATEKLVEAWAAELANGADEQHAFLRALYGSRIMMCTLPPKWQNKQVQWAP